MNISIIEHHSSKTTLEGYLNNPKFYCQFIKQNPIIPLREHFILCACRYCELKRINQAAINSVGE